MKLTVLVDNNTYIDQYYLGEPALSFYIEDGDERILFDTGYSDAFIKNAEAMHIDLGRLTYIMLSHGHNDHTRGAAIFVGPVRPEKCKAGCTPRRVFIKAVHGPRCRRTLYKRGLSCSRTGNY